MGRFAPQASGTRSAVGDTAGQCTFKINVGLHNKRNRHFFQCPLQIIFRCLKSNGAVPSTEFFASGLELYNSRISRVFPWRIGLRDANANAIIHTGITLG